ncbi:MAG: NAD(P)/FAD-dependent oxidoreductase [Pirellulaceae bacterium]
MMNWDVIVVGAGAAGLLGAARAGERGLKTLLLERNRQPGVKILMSGGTRCNLTQSTDRRGIVEAFGRQQGSFLQSALASLGPRELVALIESEGVRTKVEPTGKIFPSSDRASDVVDALVRRLNRSGAELALNESLLSVERADGKFRLTTEHRTLDAANVLLTTGGKSYPGSGTRGDGYAWAASFGHTIVEPRPALAPITTHAEWVTRLRGVTIEDVGLRVMSRDGAAPVDSATMALIARDPRRVKGKGSAVLAEQRGSFLFTHFGLSGPAVLDVSRAVSSHPRPRELDLVCDFFPIAAREELEAELREATTADGRRPVLAQVSRWIPRRLAEAIFEQAGLPFEQRLSEFSKRARNEILERVKATRIPIAGTMGFRKAEVTAGGVSLAEVDSRTMQSKLVPGLYFAGEVLDLDGPIGGYNFQSAFATAWLAGERITADGVKGSP